MLNNFEQKLFRLVSLWRTEGTASVAGRIYRRLRQPSPLICQLDCPNMETRPYLELEVYGWAVSMAGEVESVEAFVDGKLLGKTEYGLERLDVFDARSDLGLGNFGFGGVFLLTEKRDATLRQLTVRVRDSAGNQAEVKQPIKIKPSPERKIIAPSSDVSHNGLEALSPLEKSSVSVVIPTLNAGDELPVLLSSLKSQEGCESMEVIVVDSGSRDSTVELSRSYGAKVIEIAPKDFSHSAARNLGAESATGAYLLFMTQDALPGSRHWLREMIAATRAYGVVAVSPAESPRADVDLFYRVHSLHQHHFLELHKGDRVNSSPGNADYETIRKTCQLSNVACLIESEIFRRYKLRRDFAEDLDLGMRLIADGHKLALLDSTRVIHSHNRPAFYHLRRGYVDTICMANLFANFPPLPNLSQAATVNEVLVSYRQLTGIIAALERQVEFPCPIGDFLNAVETQWKIPIEVTGQAEQDHIEQRYGEFLDRLAADFLATEPPITVGMMMANVRHVVWRINRYLNAVYDSVDDALFTEFKQAVIKAHAMATGVMLASNFITSTEDNDLTTRLDRMLREGV